MSDELFPFQRVGAEWLSTQRRALLGDKMGLGKTPQAIVGAEMAGARKIGVVCPAIGRVNWQREVDRWSIYGLDLKAQSYEMYAKHKELRDEMVRWRPDVFVIDEAHYAKDKDARRTKALYGPYCRNDGMVSAAGAVWAMSGTLVPNHAHELWTHLRALFPQVLPGTGSYADFLNRYTSWQTDGHGGIQVLSSKNLTELREMVRPHLLRRVPEQVLPDLPQVMFGELGVEDEAAVRELREMERTPEVQELLSRLDDLEDIPDTDPHIASFRKACGLAKAKPLAAMVYDELLSGQYHKIVIFAYHREVISILMRELATFNAVMVMGGQGDKARQRAIDSFQDDPRCRVLVGQLQACSTTVTLTAAHQCLFAERSWVPADNEQAIYRLRRIGQKSQINARMAFLDKSIDEAINRSVARKVRGLLQLFGEDAQ